MARMEISCRRFAMFAGKQTDAGAYSVCVQPAAPGLSKRGTLALITEPIGSVALEADACRLAQRALVEGYFSDQSLGLTGSLLNALDGANNALLQYGTGWGNQDSSTTGGTQSATKTRRTRVGMTALLVRPDGTGVYLAQMAPTQAYILHKELLSALPEPEGWSPAPGRTVVTLKRVLAEDEEASSEQDDDEEEVPLVTLPAPALGSGPGIEADLIYRRVEAGDKIILVSSALASQIDREWAELNFDLDADGIVNTLAELARERQLDEAHACVLELGVTASSGVDTDYTIPVTIKPGIQIGHEGGTSTEPAAQRAGLKEALRGPREWFTRRKGEPAHGQESTEDASFDHWGPSAPAAFAPAPIDMQAESEVEQHQQVDPISVAEPVPQEAEEPDSLWSRQPTQLFVQRSTEVPPYQAGSVAPAYLNDEQEEELLFDGWEDAPPALDDPKFNTQRPVLFKPKVVDDDDFFSSLQSPEPAAETPQPWWETTPAAEPAALSPPVPAMRFDAMGAVKRAGAMGAQVIQAFVPQRTLGTPGASRIRKNGSKGLTLPLRPLILGALALVLVVLMISLVTMRSSAGQGVARNLLAEAQELQTAASQPGLTEAQRIEKLQLALAKAQEAVQNDPTSEEARRLEGKLTTDLDSAQGITRLTSLKLLFDLDAVDNAATPLGTEATEATGVTESTTSATSTGTAQNKVVVLGNDVYVMDSVKSRIYKCQVAAKTCSAVLKAGDKVGGETMGTPVAITLRVGSPVVLDDRLVSYVFNADTGAWSAERLGGADALQKPISISTYDGNLYLLGSKPGQILKYVSGQYAEAPIDWITDGATTGAMNTPAAMAIDGVIYVTLADGRILSLQGGKMTATYTPKSVPGASAPTEMFTNPDTRDIYLLRGSEGSITRLNKEGQSLATFKAPLDAGLTTFSAIAVDEGKGKLYLAADRRVYEAALNGAAVKTTTVPAAGTDIELQAGTEVNVPEPQKSAPETVDEPSARPTVEP